VGAPGGGAKGKTPEQIGRASNRTPCLLREGVGAVLTAEELQEQAEVAPVGLDRHRAESLLDRAVLEEARVEGGQGHGVAGA